jgi:Chaperone of endosialidase
LANSFNARATAGFYFVTAVDVSGNITAGVQVPGGGGSWSSLSDRNAKTNFLAVNAREVLEKLAQIPVETWNYKAQAASIRHIGPMAQDFAAAFGVGEDEKHITTVDADGVALAAIQGLNQKVETDNAELRAENAELKQRLEKLERLVERQTASR